MSEPTIPTEPTIPDGVDAEPIEQEEESPEEKKGGRPSNKQLATENRLLLAQNQQMRSIVHMMASLPDEPDRPDGFVLFELSRHKKTVRITNGDVRRAKKLAVQ